MPLGQALDELKKEVPYLSKVEDQQYSSSTDFTFLLVPRRQRPMMVGENGTTADSLAEKVGKRVRIIAGSTDKEIAEEVLYPVKISGLDTIFMPDGESLKVRICLRESKRLLLSKKDAEKVLTKLLSKKTVVELE